MNRTVRAKSPAAESAGVLSPGWLFFIGLLLAARYLQPTEAAVFGDTLWQALLWLVAAGLWCWSQIRSGRPTFCGSVLDLLLWGIVLGHALSSVPIFLEGGDRRAALNMVWEWAGLAAGFWLIRQILPEARRSEPLKLFAAMMVGIAALGIWQYHVSLPEMAANYERLRNEEARLEELVAGGSATSSQRQEFQQIREQLAAFGVPSESSARKRWEDRIQHSTEPFGTFGLANTLGGLLAAALPIVILSMWQRDSRLSLAGLLAAAGIVLYCLVLTKSRTAWVGLFAGTAVTALFVAFRQRKSSTLVWSGFASIAAAVLVFGSVYAVGGLDRQVFSEAPKSLQYRLDYWTGTFEVLKSRPLLGTGPANFRTHYLEHRPPGASEEIAAPHNLFLDVWTAGGLLSLVLLLAFLVCVLRQFRQRINSPNLTGDSANDIGPEENRRSWTPLESGAVAAFPVVVAISFLSGQGIDWRLLSIAPVTVAALLFQKRSNTPAPFSVAVLAGMMALLVHLLGADGLELPAVIQTLLLFAVVLDRPEIVFARQGTPPPVAWSIVGGFGGLAAGCLLTGLVPVLNSNALIARSEQLIRQGDASAEQFLRRASEADPLALQPKELLAELMTMQASSSGSRSDLMAAERSWNAVLAANPRSLRPRRRLAALYLSRNDPQLAAEGAELLAQAVALSPTDARLREEAATAFSEAGDDAEAAKQAHAALRLDDLNRTAGHTDLVFDEVIRRRLERLATVGQPSPGS